MANLVLFCAYRDWGISSYNKLVEELEDLQDKYDIQLVTSQSHLMSLFHHGLKPNLVLLAGWSWIIPNDILSKSRFLGIHPSDLPKYAGGSPIQHQIIDGLSATQVSLFELTTEIDGGPVIQKRPLSLEGSLSNILEELSFQSYLMFKDLLIRYPNIPYISIEKKFQSEIRKRLSPDSGKITKQRFLEMNSKDLFNFIRCRENPYPNAYLEDDVGVLEFERVRFHAK